MPLHLAIRLSLAGLLVAATSASWAQTIDPDRVMRRFMLSCDRAGKPDAVTECALAKSVQAGDVPAAVVQACRDDLGAAPVANPNEQVWLCAKYRHFGPSMSPSTWSSVAMNDCHNRSERSGHRYERRRNECWIDAAVEQRRISEADLQRCRSERGGDKVSILTNCVGRAMQRSGQ